MHRAEASGTSWVNQVLLEGARLWGASGLNLSAGSGPPCGEAGNPRAGSQGYQCSRQLCPGWPEWLERVTSTVGGWQHRAIGHRVGDPAAALDTGPCTDPQGADGAGVVDPVSTELTRRTLGDTLAVLSEPRRWAARQLKNWRTPAVSPGLTQKPLGSLEQDRLSEKKVDSLR